MPRAHRSAKAIIDLLKDSCMDWHPLDKMSLTGQHYFRLIENIMFMSFLLLLLVLSVSLFALIEWSNEKNRHEKKLDDIRIYEAELQHEERMAQLSRRHCQGCQCVRGSWSAEESDSDTVVDGNGSVLRIKAPAKGPERKKQR